RTAIGEHETAGMLTDRLIALGIPELLDVLDHLRERDPTPQVGEPTYAEKLTVEEFHLDPTLPARQLERLVRAGNPRPGAWLRVEDKRVKILAAHPADGPAAPGSLTWPGAAVGTADGQLVLDSVQVEGKRPMTGDAWLAGFRQRSVVLDVS
ncbi:MAG TPA: methionyl-tRNA formyltransferase, partial [Acidimicrobiia bacterium]|nr:methionyl-tRNA formyltransferase [Acidimicrobiia bacterium]